MYLKAAKQLADADPADSQSLRLDRNENDEKQEELVDAVTSAQ